MAVIINDFEVIVDTPAQPPGRQPSTATEAPPPPPLAPQDIHELQCQIAERRQRIRAH